jgi:hypothetical protein
MFANPTTSRQLIARHIPTPRGRSVMAGKMTPSLRRFRDYSAVGRRAYLVMQLEDGTPAYFDKDPFVPAYAIGQDSDFVEQLATGERVFCHLFVLGALPQIPFTEIRERNYDFIKRTIELGVSGVREKEDVRVFATSDALASDTDNPHPDITVFAPLQASTIADAFSIIEEHSIRVARVFVNGRDYADFRKFDRDILDQESQQHLLRTGYVGKVYGAQIIQSRAVPPGTVYICGEREFYGRMPIRMELTVVTADKPWEGTVGFLMMEYLGILNYNFLAQQRVLITRS